MERPTLSLRGERVNGRDVTRSARYRTGHLLPRMIAHIIAPDASSIGITVGITFFLSCIGVGSSNAGPHAGGVLLLSHCDDTTCFSTEENGVVPCELDLPELNCSSAALSREESAPTIAWIYAVFPEGASVSLLGLEFGISYDEAKVRVDDWGFCAPFARLTSTWPATDSGVTLVWNWSITDISTPIGWVALSPTEQGTSATFSLRRYPSGHARFANDSIPPVIDLTADFGSLGFGSVDGYAPCAALPASGACCSGQSCQIVPEIECEAIDGDYQGDLAPCVPDLCLIPVLELSWGSLKESFVLSPQRP